MIYSGSTGMECERTIWVKQEQEEEIPIAPASMLHDYPLTTSSSSNGIQEEPEQKFGMDLTANNFLGDPLSVLVSSESIKTELEIKLEVDTTESEEIASTRYTSHSTRLTDYSVSFEQAVVHDEPGKPTRVIICGNQTQEIISDEDNRVCTRDNNSSVETELRDFTCSSCIQSFTSKYRLIMQPPLYICRCCGEVFHTDLSLNNHLRIHKNDQNLPAVKGCCLAGTYKMCKSLCGQATSIVNISPEESCDSGYHNVCEKSSQLCSLSLKHKNSPGAKHPYLSYVCQKLCSNKCKFEPHTMTRIAERPQKCNTCGKSFHLDHHLKTDAAVHIAKGRHKCDVCGKFFARADLLKTHTMEHTGVGGHKCEVCGRLFVYACDLRQHASIHASEKRYKCDVCGKSFAQASQLKNHTPIHTGEGRHKCDDCGKSFAQTSGLKRHAMLHNGERRHKCYDCGKFFARVATLRRHAVLHSRERRH